MATPTTHTRTVNTHKALSDIERDVHDYYGARQGEPNRDIELMALKIAGRALSIALAHAEPVNAEPLTTARATVWRLVQDRLTELERRRIEESGEPFTLPRCGVWSGDQVCDRQAGHAGSHGCSDGASWRSWRGEPLNWCCTYCHTSNGAADRRCVNCGRRDL